VKVQEDRVRPRVCSPRLREPLFLDQRPVPFVLLVYASRDVDEGSFLHPVCPIGVAAEGEPVEAGAYPGLVIDEDLRVRVPHANEGDPGESGREVAQSSQGLLVRAPVVIAVSVGDRDLDACSQSLFQLGEEVSVDHGFLDPGSDDEQAGLGRQQCVIQQVSVLEDANASDEGGEAAVPVTARQARRT